MPPFFSIVLKDADAMEEGKHAFGGCVRVVSVTLLPEPGFHRFPIFSGGMNDCLTVLCLFFSCIALILLDDQRF